MTKTILWYIIYHKSKKGGKDIKHLIRIDEVMGRFLIARQTIYNKVGKLSIPYVKIGSKLLFYAEELYEWLSNGGDHHAAVDIMIREGRLTSDLRYISNSHNRKSGI